MRPRPIPAPNSCRHCGVEERSHAGRWAEPVGWHDYAAPGSALILARMRARSDAHNAPPAPPEPRTALGGAQPTTIHSAPTATTLRSSETVSREDTR